MLLTSLVLFFFPACSCQEEEQDKRDEGDGDGADGSFGPVALSEAVDPPLFKKSKSQVAFLCTSGRRGSSRPRFSGRAEAGDVQLRSPCVFPSAQQAYTMMLSLSDRDPLQPPSYSPSAMWRSLAQAASEPGVVQPYGHV